MWTKAWRQNGPIESQMGEIKWDFPIYTTSQDEKWRIVLWTLVWHLLGKFSPKTDFDQIQSAPSSQKVNNALDSMFLGSCLECFFPAQNGPRALQFLGSVSGLANNWQWESHFCKIELHRKYQERLSKIEWAKAYQNCGRRALAPFGPKNLAENLAEKSLKYKLPCRKKCEEDHKKSQEKQEKEKLLTRKKNRKSQNH